MADNSQTKQVRRLKSVITAYKHVFSTKQGKEILNDLMAVSYFMRPFIPISGPVDPYRMAYNEGARSMVLHILGQLSYSQEQIDLIIEEISRGDA